MTTSGISTHNRVAQNPVANRVQSNQGVANRVQSNQGVANRVSFGQPVGRLNIGA